MKGYKDCTLLIDLSTGSIVKKRLNRSYIEKFLGGEGYGSALLWYEVPYNTHAFSPRNMLSFSTGPLTGTLKSANTASVVFISPLSNSTGASTIGGRLGANIKYAGYDTVIINGASQYPVYLCIDDNNIEIRDAAHLWGKDTEETISIVKNETGSDFTVVCIGQAGEKLSRLACICSDEDFTVRGGSGSVMGHKKLKAIAIRGTGNVDIYDKERFTRNKMKIPRAAWDLNPMDIKHETFSALKKGLAKDNMGSAAAIAAHYMRAYGIDPVSTFAVISAAIKWYEGGIISMEDTDGLELRKGNTDAMVELIKKIGLREGAGETFADGLYYAALKIGQDNDGITMENSIGDMAFDTPEGGSYHINSNIMPSEALEHLLSDLNIEKSKDQAGSCLKVLKEYYMLANLLGICSNNMISSGTPPSLLAELYSSATGIETDRFELFKKSERVLSLQRALNYKKGFNKKNDYIPRVFLKSLKAFKPKSCNQQSMAATFTGLYEACGYDIDKAIPTAQKFLELSMKDILDDLYG